ncbi:hypothetical protein GCM10007063_19320 [Lentibacillus kapialis]|uniref:Uncharacterized protein n=1 Tax=Lentibacillus kapialis TaxID=340214 RepID=A0A917UYL7_9BACI|nr:hypothetical protein [Lentibacillus kapialis]GGJ97038.1 hypothetical protein GCM10007063_19320 [Lentibacillus kapialis]
MKLQQFVTETVETLGGMVIPVEYGLCHVLIPENYASYFQNKTELKLSFDFEVAEENPDSEFVTFGSYVLEQLLTLVHEKAQTTLRYADLDRLKLGNPQKKIEMFLQDEQSKIAIGSERAVFGLWTVFQYHIALAADEVTETKHQVWVNMLTNEVDPVMQQKQDHIMYQEQVPYVYPIPVQPDMETALQQATTHVKEKSEQQKNEQIDQHQISKDISRINHYYDALIAENNKRANRKGLSEAKQHEINAKTETIELERDKQLQEIYNKANGEIKINLENAIIYFVPLLEYTFKRQRKRDQDQEKLFYNPITKDFFRIA